MERKAMRSGVMFFVILMFGCGDGSTVVDDDTEGPKESDAGDISVGRGADVVFKNVSIIPMTSETVLENLSVHVSNGRISAIGPFEALFVPDGASIIDGSGMYLTPGFSDMHIHFSYPSPAEQLKLFLANGVTTVRNMWGFDEVLSAREAIEKGDVLGPRIYTTGPLIDGPQPLWEYSFILDDVNDVESAVTEMKDQGYDYIKVYDDLSVEVYDEIIRVAAAQNIPVVGHVPTRVDVNHAIESGQFSIEHFVHYATEEETGLDEQIALTVVSGIWNCPTLIVLNALEDLDAAKSRVDELLKYVAADVRSSWASSSNIFVNFSDRSALLHTLYREGANIVSGTDVDNPYIIAGFSLHTEFELMHASGLTPYEVLLTTTVNAAKMLGVEDRRGTVEVGKEADLVLLKLNPLENIGNTRTVAGVMIRGEWLSEYKIQSMLDEVENSFAADAEEPFIDDGCLDIMRGSANDEWPSSQNPYQACYEAVATGLEPVIDNFDDCSSRILQNEGRDGFLYLYNDGTSGTFTIDVESGAVHATSSGWTSWGSGIGCSISPILGDTDHCSYDASLYAGVRFRAKGSGPIQLLVATVSNVSVDEGGTCTRGYDCYDWPSGFATLTDEWQTIEFPFCAMTPEGWGGSTATVDPAEIVALHFHLNSGEDVDLWIDDLAFFTEESAEQSIFCEGP